MNDSAIFKALCEHYELNSDNFGEAVAHGLPEDIEENLGEFRAIIQMTHDLGLLSDLCEKYPDDAFGILEYCIKGNWSGNVNLINSTDENTAIKIARERMNNLTDL